MGRPAERLGGAPASVGADVATGAVGPGEPDPELALPVTPFWAETLGGPARVAVVATIGSGSEACGAAAEEVARDPSLAAAGLAASWPWTGRVKDEAPPGSVGFPDVEPVTDRCGMAAAFDPGATAAEDIWSCVGAAIAKTASEGFLASNVKAPALTSIGPTAGLAGALTGGVRLSAGIDEAGSVASVSGAAGAGRAKGLVFAALEVETPVSGPGVTRVSAVASRPLNVGAPLP
ncbi:hypothetical protein [Brevundimonas sp.]|uniref:hypothetical protein n=1 Tax=Brevundimonas sp. TaxID=1871086 RepID=UPI0035B25670